MRRDWIEERLRKIKRRKSDLGKALALPPSRVSEIINGQRRIQSNEISLLADFLEMRTEEVVDYISYGGEISNLEFSNQTENINVVGQACQINSTYSLWTKGNGYHITLPKSHKYSDQTKFAFIDSTTPTTQIRILICIAEADAKNTLSKDIGTTKIFQCPNEKDMHQIGEYKET